MVNGPFMCSMNDLDSRRDSLPNQVCQCFQCAAANATRVDVNLNSNANCLGPTSRFTYGRICASAPTSR